MVIITRRAKSRLKKALNIVFQHCSLLFDLKIGLKHLDKFNEGHSSGNLSSPRVVGRQ